MGQSKSSIFHFKILKTKKFPVVFWNFFWPEHHILAFTWLHIAHTQAAHSAPEFKGRPGICMHAKNLQCFCIYLLQFSFATLVLLCPQNALFHALNCMLLGFAGLSTLCGNICPQINGQFRYRYERSKFALILHVTMLNYVSCPNNCYAKTVPFWLI